MTRNSVNFGDSYPAETEGRMAHCPGQYAKRSGHFTGFTEADGNPDIGTGSVGVGAVMVAAPGVTRLANGAGGLKMPWKHRMKWQERGVCSDIWVFVGLPGTCLGIDIRK